MSKAVPVYQKSWFLFLGILLVSFNLRPSITAVGPLIPFIREDLNLSNGWAGLLTTLPLLTFATFSLFSAGIGKRLGNPKAILLGLILLLFGTLIRVLGGSFLLYFGTAITGIGIVICNVLLIPLIKNRLSNKIGVVTAAYTTGMTLLAAIASGISAPIAIDLDFGWKGSLLSWAGLIVVGIVVWLPQLKYKSGKQNIKDTTPKVNVWKSRLAWDVSMFMGIQSVLFFTMIAWLPDMLISRGLSAVEAGVIVSVMQLIGLVGSFTAPMIAVKFKNQVGMAILLGVMYLIGFSSLFIHVLWINYIGLILIGLGMGSSISLAYTLIGLRTKHETTTASLSGMSQSSGYYLAALGPVMFGIVFDIFNDWDMFIWLMLICSALFLYFGARSGRSIRI